MTTTNNSDIKEKIVVIGASAGAINSLTPILQKFPSDFSIPILITQHLSSFFYNLDWVINLVKKKCSIDVKIAENGVYPRPGVAYICPPAKHMEITLNNGKPCLKISINNKINKGMPSIDKLFSSAAEIYKENTIAVILTGLMIDGVIGLTKIKKANGLTIIESEEEGNLFGVSNQNGNDEIASFKAPGKEIPNIIMDFLGYNIIF